MAETELSPVAVRIREFIDFLQISNSQFADQAGIPRPTLSQLLHGRNKSVNDLLLQKLHDAFPSLNLMWLLFGNGEMIMDVNNSHASPFNYDDKSVNLPSDSPSDSAKDAFFTYMATPADNVPDSISPALRRDASTKIYRQDTDSVSLGRKVKSIIVYYTDNSFETFYPEG